MGLFDFIFGNKKKEELFRLERERQVELQRRESERIASEREEHLVENKRKSNQLSSVDDLVNECLNLELKGNVSELQNSLYRLYALFNKPGGGQLIINYHRKDNLALCFAFMLKYDWIHDSDIREVWAEDGFYCIVDYIKNQPNGMRGQAEAMIILLILLCVGRNSLKPKVQNIINKAKYDLVDRGFHEDDFAIGADNVIDQISLLAVSGVREIGPQGVAVMSQICQRFNGFTFFEETIRRKDLMKYDVMDVWGKAEFISKIIGSILEDV